jgi:hypothetical protein
LSHDRRSCGPPSWRVVYPEPRAQRSSPETLKDLLYEWQLVRRLSPVRRRYSPWRSFRELARDKQDVPSTIRLTALAAQWSSKPPRRGSPSSTRNSNNYVLKPRRSPRESAVSIGACSAAIAQFAHIAALVAPVRINRLVHTVSVTLDPDLTYGYPCPTGFSVCHYIYPTTAFFFFYAMALSSL